MRVMPSVICDLSPGKWPSCWGGGSDEMLLLGPHTVHSGTDLLDALTAVTDEV